MRIPPDAAKGLRTFAERVNGVSRPRDLRIAKVHSSSTPSGGRESLTIGTRIGSIMGTPHYMAPEQYGQAERVDGKADVFSLGVMLYEMLAGGLPFEDDSLSLFGHTPVPIDRKNSAVAPRLAALVAGADGNGLVQMLPDQSVSYGRSFELSGSVHLTQASSGGSILLEATDGTGRLRLAATEALRAPTASWVQLSQIGTVPRTGRIQVRITSTGNLKAFVDDLVLQIR